MAYISSIFRWIFINNWMNHTRDFMAFSIVAMFAYSLYVHPADNAYQETLKNIMMIAVGYYLQASKQGVETATRNAIVVANAAAASSVTTGEAQPVIVTNDADKPVPVRDGE